MSQPSQPVLPLTCGQASAFSRPSQQSEHRIRLVVILTAVMMVIEILAGWRYHSMALLADGWHMGTHVLALGVSLLAYMLSRRYSGDHRFAFGTWKIEILGAYTSALFLAIVAISMIWESIIRLLSPGEINYAESMLVAAIGLGVNLLSAWLLGDHGHHHGHHHPHHHGHHDHDHDHDHDHEHEHEHEHEHNQHAHGDLNKRAAYLHVLADAATSILAIVALLGGMLWGAAWLDPVMGLVGAAVILIWAKGLLVETSAILVDVESHGQIRKQLQQQLTSLQLQLTDLHVWRVGEGRFAAIVGLAPTTLERQRIREHLGSIPGLVHLTLELA